MKARMRRRRVVLVSIMLSLAAAAQQAPVKSPLLDHLAGHWVMRGTVSGRKTVHDVSAQWVLGHHYLQIHEIAREKDSRGQPQYEATVYVGWNEQPKQYACVWLDVYGGASPASIGLATPGENNLPFVFKDEKGEITFRNEFIYDPKADSWEWRLDNVQQRVPKPFARFKLTRQ